MLVLGIESSCDETAAAVVDETGHVFSEVVHSQIATHAPYGGVVPELASRDHVRNVSQVIRAALTRANVTVDALDAIAVTHRPGLVGALLIGVQVAKGLAWAADKPLVGVDHLVGHLLAVFLKREASSPPPPRFPFVCLLASGGHTALYRVDAPDPSAIRELGATRDDAAGECFDKVGKLLGLPYPGGPAIDARARTGDPTRVRFVAPLASSKTPEFSFSGLKTQVSRHVAVNGPPRDDQELADLCASFQAVMTRILSTKLIDAALGEQIHTVVLGGGVAANGHLRRELTRVGEAKGITVHLPPLASCTDNAAMIAYVGALRATAGARDGWDLTVMSGTTLPRTTRKGRGNRTGLD